MRRHCIAVYCSHKIPECESNANWWGLENRYIVFQLWHVFKFTAENVEAILNLANECGIEKLLEACDRYYYEKLESSTLDEDFMEYVAVAQRNGLSLAKELAVNHLSRLTTKELSELGDSLGVTTGAMAEIFKRRSELLESGRLAPGNVYLPVSSAVQYFYDKKTWAWVI